MFQIGDDAEVSLAELDRMLKALLTTGNINITQYVGGYDFVYDYCHQRSTTSGANMVSDSKTKRRNLYLHIRTLLEDHVKTVLKTYQETVKANSAEVLLSYYNEWLLYKKYKPLLAGICRYLNDKWVKVELIEGRAKIYEMDHLIRKVWQKHFFAKVNEQVTETILNLLKANRNDSAFDTSLVGSVIESYVTLDSTETMDTYRNAFEQKFIKLSSKYYKDYFAKTYYKYSTLSEFIEHVECRMAEEAARTSYLPKRTHQELAKSCTEIVIENHFDNFPTESETLIKTIAFTHIGEELPKINKHLKRLYQFVANTSKKKILCEIFKNHIQKTGEEIATKCAQAESVDAVVYINSIHKVYENYHSAVVFIFNEDANFMDALVEAVTGIMNSNDVTKKGKDSSTSHQLNKYCNVLLCKSVKNLNDQEIEEKVNVIVTVFKYIEDKDKFKQIYLNMLARRLIGRAFVSKDAEEQIIMRLKLSSTHVYTRSIEALYKDYLLTSNINKNFQKYLQDRNIQSECDIAVKVFNPFSWPIPSIPIEPWLPHILKISVDHFNSFYGEEYKGRKLNWKHTAGKGELVTNCFNKAYTLQASTLQIAVLLQFNSKLKFSVQDLVEKTLIQPMYLKEILQVLVKADLLKTVSEGTLSDNTSVELNLSFGSKRIRIDINQPLRIEYDNMLKQVDVNRQSQIEAAIVRIVKKHKRIQETQLIAEVLSELSSWFKPDVQQIKQSIAKMKEEEYVGCVGDTYRYLNKTLAV